MTPKQVQAKRDQLHKKLGKIWDEIDALKLACPHPNLTMKRGANTGNYDPSADCYWITYSCPDCGKNWTEYD